MKVLCKMFTVLLIIAKISAGEWINKYWYICTMKCYAAIKNNCDI